MGLKSGIPVTPGLKWAPFNLIAEDLHAMRECLSDAGVEVGAVNGDDLTCLWFTAKGCPVIACAAGV
ncbi:hypothetical protein O1R50_13800 [Glycomyces luteolus]|uniref:Uncharacterized protein n=1 Tax=Glycomyces luteolus TaxID=2670330 RepID=A0A9X3P9T7_9ACTN|nr:hypothetical protein [Glycomyces luteolus]MDA1360699.1 hypothetical protein [Glycomyces luteolus]